MIIRSKFKDYYDSLAGRFRDTQIVYKRERVNLDIGIAPRYIRGLSKYLYSKGDFAPELTVELILFCGKVYPFSCLRRSRGGVFLPPKMNYIRPYGDFVLSDIERERLPVDYVEGGLEDPLAERACRDLAPIIHIYRRGSFRLSVEVVLNPALKEMKFPLHPYDAFQGLMAFMAPREPVMVEVADRYKVQGKGFDSHSFRREKGGPTRKRKRKLPEN